MPPRQPSKATLFRSIAATVDNARARTIIAQEVLAALTGHGLAAEWDGDDTQPIEVSLEWKRRRDWPGQVIQN